MKLTIILVLVFIVQSIRDMNAQQVEYFSNTTLIRNLLIKDHCIWLATDGVF